MQRYAAFASLAAARRRPFLIITCALLLLTSACTQALEMEPAGGVPDSGPDTPLDIGSGDGGDFELPDNDEAPSVRFTSPEEGTQLSEALVRIEGQASDDNGLSTVFVRVGNNAPVRAESDDGYRTWHLDALTPPGDFLVEAYAIDVDGRQTSPAETLELSRTVGDDSAAPAVDIVSPEDGSSPLQTVIVLRGSTSDDAGVVRMELRINGQLFEERAFATDDQYATWSRLVPLEAGVANEVEVRAFDLSGNQGVDTITLIGRSQSDDEAPELVVDSPQDAAVIDTDMLTLRGSSSDNLGVREVKVRVGEAQEGSCDEIRWSAFTLASSSDGFATWSASQMVPAGDLCVQVRAIDVSGLRTTVTRQLTNEFVAEFGEERQYFMRLRAPDEPPQVRLELDRDGLGEILTEEIQRDLVIAELDISGLLINTFNAIKSSCGTCWQGGGSGCSGVADYDCTQTSLGCSFGDPSNGCAGWQSSPEYALVRLLTLTPANANVDGSSIGALAGVADDLNNLSFGLSADFADLFSDALGIGRNDEVVSTAGAVAAINRDLVATHPNVVFDPAEPDVPLLDITMFDALNDLAPLADRFGPDSATGHTGVIDPGFTPNGVVFPPDSFRMILVGESNLQWQDGIDLDRGKDYISLIVDETGPTFDDIIEYDFFDPARFSIQGLPPNPTVDLRFTLFESPRNIPVCTGDGCRTHTRSAPRPDFVWTLDPWELEYILADAAFITYQNLNTYTEFRFLIRAAEIFVGNTGDPNTGYPPGWSVYETFAGVGAPPPAQYVWETVMDVAEVVAHRNIAPNGNCPDLPGTPSDESEYTICEGDLNTSFTVFDVPTDVSASELEALSRQFLDEQRDILSQRLLGGFEENNGCVDFYYIERDGTRMLWYADASDPRPSVDCPAPNETNPGFYADAELSQRVSSTSVSGVDDNAHQKWVVSEGLSELYIEDGAGVVWRLRIDAPPAAQSDEISVRVARRMAN